MRFHRALPLLPSFAVAILVGAYLVIDGAADKHPRQAVALSDTRAPGDPEAGPGAFQETVFTPSDGSTELAKLQQTVQALQLSNKTLSDQVGTLAARLDNLEKARAEDRELARPRTRRR